MEGVDEDVTMGFAPVVCFDADDDFDSEVFFEAFDDDISHPDYSNLF